MKMSPLPCLLPIFLPITYNGTMQTDSSNLFPSALYEQCFICITGCLGKDVRCHEWLPHFFSAEFHSVLAGRAVLFYWSQNRHITKELKYLWYMPLGLISFSVSCHIPRGRWSLKAAHGSSRISTCRIKGSQMKV